MAAAVCLLGGPQAHAWVLSGARWPSNQPIVLHLGLGSPGITLVDGSTSWDAVATTALEIWNPYVGDGVQFQAGGAIKDSGHDGKNSVSFGSTAVGSDLGDDTLAVTVHYEDSSNIRTECDVIFNKDQRFNSYRGPLRTDSAGEYYDLRRVAIHEFGHVLGLAHGRQSLASIMSAVISDADTIQVDDIAGVEAIYGGHSNIAPVLPPEIIGTLAAYTTSGAAFSFRILTTNWPDSYGASGLPAGLVLDATAGTISGVADAVGTYDVIVTASNSHGTGSATLKLNVLPSGPPHITGSLKVTVGLGESFSYQLTGTGNPTFKMTGYSVQDGIGFDAATNQLVGVPLIPGKHAFYIHAENPYGSDDQDVEVDVAPRTAVPVNDNFANAQEITGTSGSVPGTNYQATVEAGEPGRNSGTSIWYQWTAPVTGHYYFDTGGSTYRNELFAYTGTTLSALTPVVGEARLAEPVSATPLNDDFRLNFVAQAGTTYHLCIATGNQTGNTVLGWSLVDLSAHRAVILNNVVTAQVGQPFNYQIQATNSPNHYAAADLPPGLQLDTTKGLITGTPLLPGFTLVYLDISNALTTQGAGLHLTVLSQPVVSFRLPGAAGGKSVTEIEGKRAPWIRVERSGGDLAQPLTVHYKVKGAATAPGIDTAGLTGEITIPANAASVKLRVKTRNDSVAEGARVVKLKLVSTADDVYRLGTPAQAKVHVIDAE